MTSVPQMHITLSRTVLPSSVTAVKVEQDYLESLLAEVYSNSITLSPDVLITYNYSWISAIIYSMGLTCTSSLRGQKAP